MEDSIEIVIVLGGVMAVAFAALAVIILWVSEDDYYGF